MTASQTPARSAQYGDIPTADPTWLDEMYATAWAERNTPIRAHRDAQGYIAGHEAVLVETVDEVIERIEAKRAADKAAAEREIRSFARHAAAPSEAQWAAVMAAEAAAERHIVGI